MKTYKTNMIVNIFLYDGLLSRRLLNPLHKIRNYIIAVAEAPKVLAKSILAEKIFTEEPESHYGIVFARWKNKYKKKAGHKY